MSELASKTGEEPRPTSFIWPLPPLFSSSSNSTSKIRALNRHNFSTLSRQPAVWNSLSSSSPMRELVLTLVPSCGPINQLPPLQARLSHCRRGLPNSENGSTYQLQRTVTYMYSGYWNIFNNTGVPCFQKTKETGSGKAGKGARGVVAMSSANNSLNGSLDDSTEQDMGKLAVKSSTLVSSTRPVRIVQHRHSSATCGVAKPSKYPQKQPYSQQSAHVSKKMITIMDERCSCLLLLSSKNYKKDDPNFSSTTPSPAPAPSPASLETGGH